MSANLVRAFVLGLATFGVPPPETLAAAGLGYDDISDPDARISRRYSIRLWREIRRLTGDPAIGLHAAERFLKVSIDLGILDVIDYLTRSSATLGEALERIRRYNAILQAELLDVRIEVAQEIAKIRIGFLGLPPGELPPAAEFVVATFLIRGRTIVGRDWDPLGVSFEHSAPTDLSEYRRIFRCPIEFGAPQNSLIVQRAVLDEPLASADPRLCHLLDRRAEEILARLPKAEDWTLWVRRVICDLLGSPEIRVADVAKKIGVTARTLQRRLREEGQSFQQVLDEVRRDVACREMNAGNFSVAEISLLLGFSEASAFQRAFKRWTGLSPSEYRQRGQGDG